MVIFQIAPTHQQIVICYSVSLIDRNCFWHVFTAVVCNGASQYKLYGLFIAQNVESVFAIHRGAMCMVCPRLILAHLELSLLCEFCSLEDSE